MELVSRYILYFFLYSFLGWLCESIYCSAGNKKVINRGFLNGPICPIYGFGAMLVIFLIEGFRDNVFFLFLFGMFITSILEYISGYLLETLFNTKWWDYSKRKFNIKGRVCLKNAIYFGIMSVALMKILHPFITDIVNDFSPRVTIVISVLAILITSLDMLVTLRTMNKLSIKLQWLDEVIEDLSKINIKLERFDEEEIRKAFSEIKNKEGHIQVKFREVYRKIEDVRNQSMLQRRLMRAFPNMQSMRRREQLNYYRQLAVAKKKKIDENIKNRLNKFE
ncbi:putative ABC transporter permease [Metaclostridioides mangenotii]|uniref:Membrane protein n=1 Tax=Metaclostridioides mangenotii TaxID=1540 RepID=A0ABS4E7C7_9FIRM|nr:putative ABC transporter permease [Clostridioides mangenotii]MBP1853857.1 putative membrane protein [Clostridioides mangenotii]